MKHDPPRGRWASLARRQLLQRLERLVEGRLRLRDGSSVLSFGQPSADFPLDVEIEVRDPAFYSRLALGGAVAAGASYADGQWQTSDLPGLVRILVRNRPALEGLGRGVARLAQPLRRLWHAARRNTRRGSRRNIAAHYDLGNDFFRRFLDPSLTYSSAWFPRADASLEEAQMAKLDRICRLLPLSRHEHVVEIGTGWGSFALFAAGHYGCRVTTTTISRRQYELARERVAEAGLDDRVTVLAQDYRDLQGRFDRLVSIEMIEAIGWRNLERFFATCQRLLLPQGSMALQAITIAEQCHDRARRSVDFIQTHIFPGSYIPSLGSLTAAVKAATDLRIRHVDDIGPHYARTLRLWRERFLAARRDYLAMGCDERFLRAWEFYFAYCEGGFAEGQLQVLQIRLAGPRAAHSVCGLGLDRAGAGKNALVRCT